MEREIIIQQIEIYGELINMFGIDSVNMGVFGSVTVSKLRELVFNQVIKYSYKEGEEVTNPISKLIDETISLRLTDHKNRRHEYITSRLMIENYFTTIAKYYALRKIIDEEYNLN